MRKYLFVLCSLPILFFSCHARQRDTFGPIAVVELFTSEGCSSCPPADELLTRITAEAEAAHREVFTLSFHVDYWDRLGWKDPFSSSSYSDRQRQYAGVMDLSGVYTPQAVVNGSYEVVGSDESKLNDAVAKALSIGAAASFTKLESTHTADQKLSIRYGLKGSFKDCDIHFALVSKQESTAVRRGENSGRRLTHTHVVRQFISTPAAAEGEVSFASSPLPGTDNTAIIAYLQHRGTLRIIAAEMIKP